MSLFWDSGVRDLVPDTAAAPCFVARAVNYAFIVPKGYSLSIMKKTCNLTSKAIISLVLVAGVGCGGSGGGSGNSEAAPELGALQIGHTLDGGATEEGDASLHSVITGLDASGKVIYGPVTLPYDDEHTVEDVPTEVVHTQIEHRLGTGQLIALAQMPVEVQANQLTQVRAAATGAPKQATVELVNDTGTCGRRRSDGCAL